MHATPVEPIQENTIWCMQVVTIQSTHTGQCARAYINKLQTLLSTIPHHTLSIADQILHTFKEIMCVITLPKKKNVAACHTRNFMDILASQSAENILWRHF